MTPNAAPPARLVVLAGGTGEALVKAAGLSLVERALAGAWHAGFDDLVVVTTDGTDEVERLVLAASRRRGLKIEVVRDLRRLDGPLPARPVVVLPGGKLTSDQTLQRLRHEPVEPDQVVVAASGALVCGPAAFANLQTSEAWGNGDLSAAIQGLAEVGALRAVNVDGTPGHGNLFRAAGKPADGTLASRLNLALSVRVITPALVALRPAVTPNQVTLLALTSAVTAAVCIALGAPLLGGVLVALSSVLDRSDGEVARLTYRSSVYGGFLDAVLDRVADGILFTGIAIHLLAATDLPVPVLLVVSGAALMGHQMVSYTTARAVVELGHRYHGPWLGGGKGRDRRLLLLTLGTLAAAAEPLALVLALVAVAGLSWGIVVVRLRQSWWVAGPGAAYVGVRAVVLDLDGTVADSMGFLTDLAVGLLVDELQIPRADAVRRYVATAGSEFAVQLEELAPAHPRLAEVARRFEAEKARWMPGCSVFEDVLPAVDRLTDAGIPVLLCSSTREPLVRAFCDRHGLTRRLAAVDGWRPGHDKPAQLAAACSVAGAPGADVLFVGDAARDAAVARASGTRFVGLVRAGRPDALAGSGAEVVSSLTALTTNLIRAARSPVRVGPPA